MGISFDDLIQAGPSADFIKDIGEYSLRRLPGRRSVIILRRPHEHRRLRRLCVAAATRMELDNPDA
jgi:hypothetical protein